MQPELGEVIARLRAENGIGSQEKLADIATRSTRTINRIEAGENYQMETIGNIADALGVSVKELFDMAKSLRDDKKLHLDSKPENPQSAYMHTMMSGTRSDWATLFTDVDRTIATTYGQIFSPTQGLEVGFNSRRLFTSLSMIDIPPDVCFHVVTNMVDALQEVGIGMRFDTGDVRLAVSKILSNMSLKDVADLDVSDGNPGNSKDYESTYDVWESKKMDWAKRYSRQFGDPNQPIFILERNGQVRKLDFEFLKKSLIPKMLERAFSKKFRAADTLLIGSNDLSEMAEQLLKELRRLGLYQMRYKTALYLAEEIALQPPHPWIVTPETRDGAIAYDMERAERHLDKLQSNTGQFSHDDWHRFTELFHHGCSAILGIYSGFLGHDYLMPLRNLLEWLRIQERNSALWDFCELRFIYDDLRAIGETKDGFHNFLENVDTWISSNNMNRKTLNRDDAVRFASRLFEIARLLRDRRSIMRTLKTDLKSNIALTETQLLEFAKASITAIFKDRKLRAVTDGIGGRTVGFSYSVDFHETDLKDRKSFCIFLTHDSFKSTRTFNDTLDLAVRLVRRLRLVEVAFIIHRGPLTSEQRQAIHSCNEETESGVEIFGLSFEGLISATHATVPHREFATCVLEEDLQD